MPRGRGNNRGFRPGPPRGRGRGRGRGFRGAIRGGRGGAVGGDEGTLVFEGNFEDFNLDHILPPSHRQGASPARGRGGYQTPHRGFQNRGGRVFRGGKPVRGIGFAGSSQGPRIPISVLERDRPLLRPVIFVRGEHQKTLFQEVEEILHVHGEEGGAIEDHAPSADVVERLFNPKGPTEDISPDSGRDSPPTSESDEAIQTEIAIEMAVASEETVGTEEVLTVEMTVDAEETLTGEETIAGEEPAPMFIVDTTPSPVILDSRPSERVVDSSAIGATPLGEAADEEVIVYVAPHPRRSHNATPTPSSSIPASDPLPLSSDLHTPIRTAATFLPPVSTPIDSISISLPPSSDREKVLTVQVQARRRASLKPTPRSRKMVKKERAAARRREERHTMFNFGLSMEERSALREGPATKVDPRRAERRQGDSDVDWGTDDEGGIEEVRSGIGDMDLDAELGDVAAAFAQFARGVPGLGAGEAVTIADLDDAVRMKEEDEDEDADGEGSSQDENVFKAKERREIGEDADSDSSESSDEGTPGRGFQARLKRLREKAKLRAVVDADPSSDEKGGTDEEGVFGPDFSWADRDESFLRGIEDLLDENDDVLHGGDRKARNKLFKAIQNGDFEDDYEDLEPLNMRKKDRNIPPQLRDQWERDRTKKAERKRNRALARLQAAADLPPTRKGSGKKLKIFGAARIDGDTVFTDRVNDMALLEQQIRTFLGDLELKSMVLPPKGKDWRKRAHLLADAFNLQSKSKGKGEGRFTTLIKTTRSGVSINERKISRLVNGNKGEGFDTTAVRRTGKTVRNQREGDEVGKLAPKLGEANLGFKLLQQMGWEEGDRIGVTGGLVDPLTAIIKTTKLGLGATR